MAKLVYGEERTIIKDGSSLVVCIPRAMLKSVGLKLGDKVMVFTDGKRLMIEKRG